MAKSVFSVGIDPSLVDFSAMPGLDADKVRAGVAAQLARMRELGFEAEGCFVDLGETAEEVLTEQLKGRSVDCVLIGAGVRQPAYLLLFEKIINVVHAHAPGAKICFNTSPADSVEAVQRWI